MDNIEQQPTTTTLPALTTISTVSELIIKNFSSMQAGSAAAVAALKQIENITNDQEMEQANLILVGVNNAYKKINALRAPMTSPFDDLKKELMAPEKALDPDEKTSEVHRVRLLIAKFRQEKIDKEAKIKREAEKRKIKDDHIVDIKTNILKLISDVVIKRAKNAETTCSDFFKNTTLELWDTNVEKFKTMKPKLKLTEEYEPCFKVNYNRSILEEDEFLLIVTELKTVETYDKWNEEYVKLVTPIINAWKAKIPDLKKEKDELAAADATEKERIAKEQQDRAQKEADDRQAELNKQAQATQSAIESKATTEKMANSFTEQATVLKAEPVGPTKWVVKFKDPTKAMEPFMNVVMHCMAHPDFPGIQKRDKKKNFVNDSKGRMEYVDPIDWFMTFFAEKCDNDVDGVEWFQDPKVIAKAP